MTTADAALPSRPVRGRRALGRPLVEHPTVEHPTVEHPKVEHPKIEHPKAEHPKYVGLMRLNRRQMTFTGMAFAMLLAAVPALPASAEPVEAALPKVSTQSIDVPHDVALNDVSRGAFTASEYSEVQSPVPMSTPISSGFGYRIPPCAGCSSYHRGIDLTPGVNYPVQAMADGVVREVGNPSGGLGVYVTIDHVIDGRKVATTYAHMALGSLTVAVGQAVSRGTVVGKVGSTGQSTGPHLYFQVLLDGVTPVDPHEWLLAHVNAS